MFTGPRQVDDPRLQDPHVHQPERQHVHDGPSRPRKCKRLRTAEISLTHLAGTQDLVGQELNCALRTKYPAREDERAIHVNIQAISKPRTHYGIFSVGRI